MAAIALLAPHATSRANAQTARLTQGSIEFVYAAGAERFATALAATALLPPLPVLPPDILETGQMFTVYLAPDEAAFDSLTSGSVPHWGAGVALPGQGIIVLPAYASARGSPDQLGPVLRHELAHVALQRYLGPIQIPRWFTEGYATWAAGQLDDSAGWLLRLAFITGAAPPLDSIALDWPAGSSHARVAYLLSASVIEFLHERGDDRVMRIFLERWRDDTSFERALYDVYGFTPGLLEKHWSTAVRRRYGWLLFLTQSAVVGSITGIIVLALFTIRRRRDRRRMERLRANEIPDAPAFWIEPPPGTESPQAIDATGTTALPEEPGAGKGPAGPDRVS